MIAQIRKNPACIRFAQAAWKIYFGEASRNVYGNLPTLFVGIALPNKAEIKTAIST